MPRLDLLRILFGNKNMVARKQGLGPLSDTKKVLEKKETTIAKQSWESTYLVSKHPVPASRTKSLGAAVSAANGARQWRQGAKLLASAWEVWGGLSAEDATKSGGVWEGRARETGTKEASRSS